MASENISSKFQGLKIKANKDINILLLGETGVGKSTFINSLANYLHFKSFKQASKADDLLILIPSVITVTDKNLEQFTFSVGSDNNEFQEIGAAGTQDVKTYVFPIGEGTTRLRLIDSPGVGDPRGIERDDINCENILFYLSQIEELHAICFLLKPTTTRKTILFEYCVKQILSRLEKSASKNIIFVFTNTRGSNYSPGDTLPCLKTIIDEIKSNPPYVDIPFKNNIFSFDNEAFRFLAAIKKKIEFNDDVRARFIESWNNSSKECSRLISYIIGDVSHDGLKPHQLKNTISINEARRLINNLSQPLAEISQLIHDNIRILERHQGNLRMENQSLNQLKKKLYIPAVNLEVTTVTQPVTVCTSAKCADLIKVGELRKWHYRQRCHDPCYLTNVSKEIVGDLNLMHCVAMNERTCTKCTCDFSLHQHIYYMTKPVEVQIVDEVVKSNIYQKEEAIAESRRLLSEIDKRKRELEIERETIIKSTAQFAHFLQNNAISPFNDSYKTYIEYLITRERSLGRHGDPEVVDNLEHLLRRYDAMKDAFDHSLEITQQFGVNSAVTLNDAQSVIHTIHQLYQLKHNGKKIREMVTKQKSSRQTEHDKTCEYVHPKTSRLSSSEAKSKKNETSDSEKKVKKQQENKKHGNNKPGEKKNPNERPRGNNNYQNTRRPNQSGNQQNIPPLTTNVSRCEPPPPYPGAQTSQDYGQRVNQNNPPARQTKEVTVKIEVPFSDSKPYHRDHYEANRYPPPPPQGYPPPPPQGYPPPPPQGYPPPPPQSYPPHDYNRGYNAGPDYPPPPHPPQDPYYRPDLRYGPSGPHYEYHGPSGSYYERPPPPNPQYYPPPNQHGGPPYDPYRGQNYYQAPPGPQNNKPNVKQGNQQKGYKTNFKKRDHGNHPHRQNVKHNSKTSRNSRNNTKKSGNEKNSSLSSDSSSD